MTRDFWAEVAIAAGGAAAAGGASWLVARSAGLLHRADAREDRALAVVITGSTRGLGAALASEFLRLGDRVVVTGRSAEDVERAVRDLRAAHPSAVVRGCACDVRDAAATDALASYASAELGAIDVWVNNAGVSQFPKACAEMTWRAQGSRTLTARI
jgi:short-subunit dehydrogenase